MQTEKPKQESSSSWYAHPLIYALLWGLGMAGMTQIIRMLITAIAGLPWLDFTPQQYDAIAILIPTMMTGLIPVLLTERLLKHSMRNWLVYTLIGTLVGWLWFYLFSWDANDPLVLFLHTFSGVWVSLVQSLWLRGRVKHAWLWVVAHYVVWQVSRSLVPHGIPFSQPLQLMIWTFGQQVVLALLMHTLWQQPRDMTKSKVDAASDEAQNDEARLQRLQAAESHDDLWDYQEPQAQHSQA